MTFVGDHLLTPQNYVLHMRDYVDVDDFDYDCDYDYDFDFDFDFDYDYDYDYDWPDDSSSYPHFISVFELHWAQLTVHSSTVQLETSLLILPANSMLRCTLPFYQFYSHKYLIFFCDYTLT